MAKVKGPMHSDSAGGQFGKNMIFRSVKKGTVVTGYYKPGSAKKFTLSEAQLAQREKYGQAVEDWRALTNEEREIFNENAKPKNISGWNLYFKNYTGVTPPPEPDYTKIIVSGAATFAANGTYNRTVFNPEERAYVKSDGNQIIVYTYGDGTFFADMFDSDYHYQYITSLGEDIDLDPSLWVWYIAEFGTEPVPSTSFGTV
jgi:hypothetical protein